MKSRSWTMLLMCAAAAPSIAVARPNATTRLVSCDTGNCLLLRGHRASADAAILVNGHPVAVQGKAAWRVLLPLATVRDWSAPFARTVSVAVGESASANGEAVDLPVGLFGRSVELASLVVRAH